MRQRLLLVAGWLAAAIGAGLVASGAVAVAGGQVLDRPLRPLTAAEVAALPVETVGPSDSDEPHASGGVDRTTGGSTAGSENDEPELAEDASTGRSATSDTTDDNRWDRFTKPGTSETKVVSLSAGKASFATSEVGVQLLWATPGAGYVMSTVSQDEESVVISFSSGLDIWIVEATIIDESLDVRSYPAPIA